MPDTELLAQLAEIAGVFVGFGALISVRSEGPRDDFEIVMLRFIVWYGILVVVTALSPVVIGQFGLDGHALWMTCSIFFLVLYWGGGFVLDRLNPERTRLLAEQGGRARIRLEIPAAPIWLAANIALILILIGRLPEQEAALYLAAVALTLVLNALMLLYLAFNQGSRWKP